MDRFGMYNESICSATYRTQPSVHSAWIFQPTRRVRTRITFIPPKPTPALSTATCCNIGVTCNNYQVVCSRSSWARIRLRSKYACPSAVMDWWAAISLSPVRKTLVRYSSWISRFAGGALWRMYRSSRPYISALTFLARRCSLTRTTTSTPRLLPHGLNEYGRIGTRATDGRSDGRTIPIIWRSMRSPAI